MVFNKLGRHRVNNLSASFRRDDRVSPHRAPTNSQTTCLGLDPNRSGLDPFRLPQLSAPDRFYDKTNVLKERSGRLCCLCNVRVETQTGTGPPSRICIMLLMRRILICAATGNIGGQILANWKRAGQEYVRWCAIRTRLNSLRTSRSCAAISLVVRPLITASLQSTQCSWGMGRCRGGGRSCFGTNRERVRRIVFLSAPLKTAHPLFQQPNPSRTRAELIERLIEKSNLSGRFCGPGCSLNALGWWAPQIRAGDVVRWPYLDVPTAPIDERDVAAVAVRTLCEDTHSGKEYVMTWSAMAHSIRADRHHRSRARPITTYRRSVGRGLDA